MKELKQRIQYNLNNKNQTLNIVAKKNVLNLFFWYEQWTFSPAVNLILFKIE